MYYWTNGTEKKNKEKKKHKRLHDTHRHDTHTHTCCLYRMFLFITAPFLFLTIAPSLSLTPLVLMRFPTNYYVSENYANIMLCMKLFFINIFLFILRSVNGSFKLFLFVSRCIRREKQRRKKRRRRKRLLENHSCKIILVEILLFKFKFWILFGSACAANVKAAEVVEVMVLVV